VCSSDLNNLWRQAVLSALVSIVVLSLYHFIFIAGQRHVEGAEYKGWRAGDYVIITSRSATRTKPDGLPFFVYSWCRIEAVSTDSLKVKIYYGTDDGDIRSDTMTNPTKFAGEASNIDFEKIRNIGEWPKTFGPKKPFWIFR
jgi:hypothetical protein